MISLHLGSNDDWYDTNVDEDISAVSVIDSLDLLESRAVYPYTPLLGHLKIVNSAA